MTEKEQVEALKKAKAEGNREEINRLIVEMLRPEARQAVELSKKDITHKDGYTSIMHVASGCGIYKHLFVDSCVLEGYPADTAELIHQLI